MIAFRQCSEKPGIMRVKGTIVSSIQTTDLTDLLGHSLTFCNKLNACKDLRSNPNILPGFLSFSM